MADENQAQLRPVVTRKPSRLIDLTGSRFGKLTALSQSENIGRWTTWACQCECGSTIVVKTMRLRGGTKSSCGCDRRVAAPDAVRKVRAAQASQKWRLAHPEALVEMQRASDQRPSRKAAQRVRAAKKRATPEGIAYRREYSVRQHVKAKASVRAKSPSGKAISLRFRLKETSKAKRAQYMRSQRSTPEGCINNRMSVALNRGLALGKNSVSWKALVGYSLDDLKRHIERQFTKGMSWDRFGDIHIDHIQPLSSFHFTSVDDADFKAAWALTNLRPLWASANMSKGAKREVLL